MLSSIEIEMIVRVLVAAALGVALGFERTLAGKHAGMRTYGLVAMGSALFTVAGILASYQFSMFAAVSPLHLAGFVIVGIGFIGSGLAAVGNQHPELTTAAGMWLAAAVGLAAGFGYYSLAVASTVLVVVMFSLLLKLENSLRRRYSPNE